MAKKKKEPEKVDKPPCDFCGAPGATPGPRPHANYSCSSCFGTIQWLGTVPGNVAVKLFKASGLKLKIGFENPNRT